MAAKAFWIFGFLALYGVHASARYAMTGGLPVGASPMVFSIVAIASLVALALLVAGHIASRDEVLRRFATEAGAVAALAVGVLSYGLSAFNIDAPHVASNLWAVAMAICLFVYGARLWLAR